MMASSRGRNRSSSWDGSGFGRIGCLLNQPEEHAIMNRIKTEDSSYASARNRKLLAEWVAKAGENEYAEPALNPCQTTAYAFFTGDQLTRPSALLPLAPPVLLKLGPGCFRDGGINKGGHGHRHPLRTRDRHARGRACAVGRMIADRTQPRLWLDRVEAAIHGRTGVGG